MIVNPYLASRLAGVSWGELHTVFRALEATLEHLVDAAGGPKALAEDALLIVKDVLAHPGQQPLMVVAADVFRIIEKAVAEKRGLGAPEARPRTPGTGT